MDWVSQNWEKENLIMTQAIEMCKDFIQMLKELLDCSMTVLSAKFVIFHQ
jgi:hypothetical protein